MKHWNSTLFTLLFTLLRKQLLLLLSLLLPFYMIVPTRELVNTLFLSTTKDSKFDLIVLDNYNMDMDINIPRERTPSSNMNSLRVSLTHSNAFSIPYHERMTIQSKDPSWSEQIENEEEIFSLLYTTLKIGEETLANKAIDNSPKDGVNHVK